MSTEVAVIEDNGFAVQAVDLSSGALPDLNKAEVLPFEMMSDYWTPETPGESKRLFFDRITTRMALDQQSGEPIELECANFFEQDKKDDGLKTISNGSKRLVGLIQSLKIPQGMPLYITYLGKKKNKSNQFQSDYWSVKQLRISI